MTDERELLAALEVALDPTPVHWGFAPFESSSVPPSLPMVIVQRLNYATTNYEDMCEGPYVGDTLLLIDAWAIRYDDGRTLSTATRAAVIAAGGWRLQGESDLFDPNFRAWRIQGQWLQGGEPPL